jgi:hypothetical protein
MEVKSVAKYVAKIKKVIITNCVTMTFLFVL